MSISAFHTEFNNHKKIRIEANTQYASDNPYPIDELNVIKEESPDSAIAQLYDENGEIKDMHPLRAAAKEQDRDLWQRLRKGSKGLQKLKNNEMIEFKKSQSTFNKIWKKYKSAVETSEKAYQTDSLKDSINYDTDVFEEMLYSHAWEEAGETLESVELKTVHEAFKEKLNEYNIDTGDIESDTGVSAINDMEETTVKEGVEIGETTGESELKEPSTITEEVGGAGPINLPEEIVKDEMAVEGEISSIPTGASILDNVLSEKTANLSEEETTTLEEKVSSGASPLGDDYIKNLLAAVSGPASDAAIEETTSNISNVVNNEGTTNITNEAAQGGIEDARGAFDATGIESPINEPIEEKKEGKLKGFFKKASAKLAPGITNMLNKQSLFGGFGGLGDIAGSTINTIKEKRADKKQEKIDGGRLGFETGNTISPVDAEETSVAEEESVVSNLETSGISKLAPEPPPVTKKDIENVGQGISSTIADTGAATTTAVAETTTQTQTPTSTEATEKSSVSETEAKEDKASAGVNINMGMLEKRLKNIELLLMGPLEVKIKK